MQKLVAIEIDLWRKTPRRGGERIAPLLEEDHRPRD
jgi:hypothetical protein